MAAENSSQNTVAMDVRNVLRRKKERKKSSEDKQIDKEIETEEGKYIMHLYSHSEQHVVS